MVYLCKLHLPVTALDDEIYICSSKNSLSEQHDVKSKAIQYLKQLT